MPKTGFPYFPCDTDRFQDIKIKRLKKEFHGNGYAVYSYIITEIYRVQGCYLEWDECTTFDVAEYWGMKETTVREIVNYCCAVGLFDKELLTNERVLSSRSIQTRYLNMCKLTKRKPRIPDKYMLLSEEDTENSEKLPQTPTISPQSKYKDSKPENNKSPSIPQTVEEENYLSSPLSAKDGIERNYNGLLVDLKLLAIPSEEIDLISRLSNYGQIGHPVWQYIKQAIASINKPSSAKDKIRLPGRFIIAKLKQK